MARSRRAQPSVRPTRGGLSFGSGSGAAHSAPEAIHSDLGQARLTHALHRLVVWLRPLAARPYAIAAIGQHVVRPFTDRRGRVAGGLADQVDADAAVAAALIPFAAKLSAA